MENPAPGYPSCLCSPRWPTPQRGGMHQADSHSCGIVMKLRASASGRDRSATCGSWSVSTRCRGRLRGRPGGRRALGDGRPFLASQASEARLLAAGRPLLASQAAEARLLAAGRPFLASQAAEARLLAAGGHSPSSSGSAAPRVPSVCPLVAPLRLAVLLSTPRHAQPVAPPSRPEVRGVRTRRTSLLSLSTRSAHDPAARDAMRCPHEPPAVRHPLLGCRGRS